MNSLRISFKFTLFFLFTVAVHSVDISPGLLKKLNPQENGRRILQSESVRIIFTHFDLTTQEACNNGYVTFCQHFAEHDYGNCFEQGGVAFFDYAPFPCFHAATLEADISLEELQTFADAEGISIMEENEPVHKSQGADANQSPTTWGLHKLSNWEGATDSSSFGNNYVYTHRTDDGLGVKVYVLDTGFASVWAGSSEFEGGVLPGMHFSSGEVVDCDGVYQPQYFDTEDGDGHGTHVAGTIASKTYGVAKSASIVPVRVLGSAGCGFTMDIINGINWVTNNCRASNQDDKCVINMSLGGGASSAEDLALQAARSANIVSVVAAGNDWTDASFFSPARSPDVITVGSHGKSHQRTGFSNYGSVVDIYAPGESVRSTDVSGQVSDKWGTSMASPHVAGLVAAILQHEGRQMNMDEVMAEFNGRWGVKNIIGDTRGSNNLCAIRKPLLDLPTPRPTQQPTAPTNAPTPRPANPSSIGCDQTVNFYLDAGELWQPALSIAAGTQVTISLCGGATWDTFLGESRGELCYNDDSCGLQSQCTFSMSNNYVPTIRGYSSNHFGEGTVTVTCSNTGTPATTVPTPLPTTNFPTPPPTQPPTNPPVQNSGPNPSSISCGQLYEFTIEAGEMWTPSLNAPEGTVVTLSTCGHGNNWDTRLGSPIGETLCNNDDWCGLQSQCNFVMPDTYTPTIRGYGQNHGTAVLEVTCEESFANPTVISCGDTLPFQIGAPNAELLVDVVAPAGAEVIISTCGSHFDTILGNLGDLCYNDDHGSCGLGSTCVFTAPSQYAVVVRGYGSNFGSGTLTMECSTGPSPTDVPVLTDDPMSTDAPMSTAFPTRSPTMMPTPPPTTTAPPTSPPSHAPTRSPTMSPTPPPTLSPTAPPTAHPTKASNPESVQCGDSVDFHLSAGEVWNPTLLLAQGDFDVTLSTCNPLTTFDTVLAAWGAPCYHVKSETNTGGALGGCSECRFASEDSSGTLQVSGFSSSSFGVGRLEVTCTPTTAPAPSVNPPMVECGSQVAFSLEEQEVWNFAVNAEPGTEISLSTCNSDTLFDTMLMDSQNFCYSDDLGTAECPLASACNFDMTANNEFSLTGFGGIAGTGRLDVVCGGNTQSPLTVTPGPDDDFAATCGDELTIDISGRGDIKYVFIAAEMGVQVNLSTCNQQTDFDTVLEDPQHDDTFSCSNDDSYGCGLQSRCHFTSNGEGHRVGLRGYGNASGQATFTITCE